MAETGRHRGGIYRKMQIVGKVLFPGLSSKFVDVYNIIGCYNFSATILIYIYTPYIFFKYFKHCNKINTIFKSQFLETKMHISK